MACTKTTPRPQKSFLKRNTMTTAVKPVVIEERNVSSDAPDVSNVARLPELESVPDADVVTPGKRVPKKKGKELDMSKFRVENVSAISPTKKKMGNFVNVMGLAGGIVVLYGFKIKSDSEDKPFFKFVKADIAEGLSDVLIKKESKNAGIVKNLGISVMCPRRGFGHAVGEYPWMQFVHVLPVGTENTSEVRRDLQKRFISYLENTKHDPRYTYGLKFNYGQELTNPNEPLQVNTALTDKDTAVLF